MKFSKIIPGTLFTAGIFIALLSSCRPDGMAHSNEEGIIEFATTPTNKTDPLFELAPNKAVLSFKGDKFIIEMNIMGVFNTAIIGDLKAKTLAQTVKFMNIKQYCVENEQEIIAGNLDFPLKLEETNETKELIGLKCYKVRATKLNAPGGTFDVWYTKDLGMENCNVLNPYAQLKGVLIDYRIKKMGLEMHLVAKSYKNSEVSDVAFDIPASLKAVSKDEMMKVFTDI